VTGQRAAAYALPPFGAATWSPGRLARGAPNWMFCVGHSRSQRPCQRFGSAGERAHSLRRAWLSLHRAVSGCGGRSGQPRGTGLHVRSKRRCPASRLSPARRPALSGRRQGKSCSSAAGSVRPGAAGASPPAISLAEHRVESGAGPDLPDLLRAAEGDGDLGGPPQRLLGAGTSRSVNPPMASWTAACAALATAGASLPGTWSIAWAPNEKSLTVPRPPAPRASCDPCPRRSSPLPPAASSPAALI
jgi:hypothetical protein